MLLFGLLVPLAAGCQSGSEYRKTLEQLYAVDEKGNLHHATSIKELNLLQRFLKQVIGPFGIGYNPTPREVKVEDPGLLGRETIIALSHSLDDNPALLAFAIPQFSELARKGPFDLTRAQAVKAISTALERQVPRVPPVEKPFEENPQAVNRGILELLGGNPADRGPEEGPKPMAPERKRAIIDVLSQTDYRTFPGVSRALKALGVVARHLSSEPEAIQRATVEGIYRLCRILCRLTLEDVLQREDRPMVRGTAAEALQAARTPWAERILLRMVEAETDPVVIRKVFRALTAYRTPAVAQTLLAEYRKNPDPLETALIKRALLNFTRQDMGRNPDGWEKRLRELGYLKEDRR